MFDDVDYGRCPECGGSIWLNGDRIGEHSRAVVEPGPVSGLGYRRCPGTGRLPVSEP